MVMNGYIYSVFGQLGASYIHTIEQQHSFNMTCECFLEACQNS